MSDPWTMFEKISTFLDARDDLGTIDEKIDRYATAGFVMALDAITTADRDALRDGWSKAKFVRDRLLDGRETPHTDPMYVAGRFAALADALGTAAQRCSADEFRDALKDSKYHSILRELAEKPLSNKALAEAIGESVESTCRKLQELRALNAVVSRQQGRHMVNALTPSARAFVPDGPAPRASAGVKPFDLYAMRPGKAVSMPKSSTPHLPAINPQAGLRQAKGHRSDFAA